MRLEPSSPRRILLSALAALALGLAAVAVYAGGGDSFLLRALEGLAVFAVGAAVISGATALAITRLAGWRNPESEEEFERIVERAERLAAGEGVWDAGELLGGEESEEDLFDPYDEEDFRALVRGAVEAGHRRPRSTASGRRRWRSWLGCGRGRGCRSSPSCSTPSMPRQWGSAPT